MKFLKERFEYLFTSTKGLVLVAISLISLVTAIWGTLSGPMIEWGIRDITVKLLSMKLSPVYREGRIIMLYHTIAMAVIAIEVYLITSLISMKKNQKIMINATITIGYITAMVFGLWFAYFGRNFLFHGLFLVGQSLVFYSGILLANALWPWRKEYRVKSFEYAHTKSGIDLERVAFFTMTVATLGSAMLGGIVGSYWGNGHQTFLAEDLIRLASKNSLQLAVIGHLHIMLTLIAIAITLIVGRWFDFKGILHKIAMPLMISGTIVITIGVWMVVPFQLIAHIIIYVGSVLVMLSALMLVIFAWDKIIKERIKELGIEKPGFFTKLKALLHDPIKFGPFWQMVFMNFTVSGVGIFMAVKLDEIFRVWPFREERIALTGHWHVLSGLIATIILMYYVDMIGLKGKARKWFGWILIIGSDIAFAAATVYSLKRLFVKAYFDEKIASNILLFIDFGLGAILVILAMLLIWRLFDLFRTKGKWRSELDNPEPSFEKTAIISSQREVQ